MTGTTAVLPGGAEQQTAYVYGVGPATGSAVSDDDLLAQAQYPDPTTGAASAAQAETYAYERARRSPVRRRGRSPGTWTRWATGPA